MKNLKLKEYFDNNGYMLSNSKEYYYKEFGCNRTICFNIEKKLVEVGHFGIFTETILNFFNENKNSFMLRYSKIFDYYFLTLRFNRQTGELFNFTINMISDEEFYDKTEELVLPLTETTLLCDEYFKIKSLLL